MSDDPRTRFAKTFGRPPTLRVRAPGRVNLIGEHIDYAGLAVLPMALERGITLHVAPRDDDRVRVVDSDPAYGERSVTLVHDRVVAPPGDWANYLVAGVFDRFEIHDISRGFDALLTSTLPPASGLSSSAALVVASALAAEAVWEVETPPQELAAALARAERSVGTEGGGMDQAASLCGKAGHALHIGFDPLAVDPVAIPDGWHFVIADSGVRAAKSGAARDAYNDRSRSTRSALALLREALGEPDSAGYRGLLARHTSPELLDVAASVLPPGLLPRFRHVVTEGGRVGEAREALEADEPLRFGALMDASHASLRDDFEVSHEALDRLVDRAREAGAHGARLTGAGFGGCVVALCGEGEAEGVIAALDAPAFEARAGGGAEVTDA